MNQRPSSSTAGCATDNWLTWTPGILILSRATIWSIVIIKTVTGNHLTTTARARLQITANLVKRTAPNSAIIAHGMLRVIRSAAVWHAVKLPAIDDKLRQIPGWVLIAAPS
jgi:hypothetical protein